MGPQPDEPLETPTDRPLQLGDPISPDVPLWIVAKGPNVGEIGTAQALGRVPGRTIIQEGAEYDPVVYPDLAAFLKPFYGEHRVPPLSSPEWL